MLNKISLTAGLLAIFTSVPAYAQFAVTFQNGRMLPTGVVYEGTDDVEFVSADLTGLEDRSSNPTITVDGNDGGNITQGAIRFNDLLVSQGGAIPDEVATNPDAFTITRATLSLFKTSGTAPDAEIACHRVISEDNFSGQFWQEEDSWADLTDNIFPVGPNATFIEWPFGPAELFQFRPEGYAGMNGFPGSPATGDTAITPDFVEPTTAKQFTFQGTDFLIDNTGTFAEVTPENLALGETSTDLDSEDIINSLEGRALDTNDPLTFQDAFAFSFFEFDVTDTILDWLVDGEANQGWSISNNTGDGWDVASSEAEGVVDDQGFFDGETVIPGVDQLTEGDLPAGIAFGETPGTLVLDGEGLRPALTIFYDGAGGAADLNFDGVADLDDYALFLAAFGGEINGPLSIGATGDLDFDRDVDPADFQLFKAAFADANDGMSLGEALSAVPEPASVALLGLGLAFLAGRGRDARV